VKIYVPRDAAALGVGADQTAQAIVAEARRRGVAIELIRNGSRGLLWLEPLVEVNPRMWPACSTRTSRPASRMP
jgi:formate dehydrogenase iron-sulfur subunit